MDARRDPRLDPRPMAFGSGDRRRIADPIFEPLWAGRRSIAILAAGVPGAVFHDETGGPIAPPADLGDALRGALLADAAVLDGYLVPGPLAETAGVMTPVGMDAVMKPTDVTRQLFLGGGGRRDERRARLDADEARRVAVATSTVLAYVAVDLLEIDGVTLVDVPLQERKRLLDGALVDGDLVRRTVAVREPVETWYAQWKALGFLEVAVKAANSRYVPGGRATDWATEIIPRR